jgi:hypothetical protein
MQPAGGVCEINSRSSGVHQILTLPQVQVATDTTAALQLAVPATRQSTTSLGCSRAGTSSASQVSVAVAVAAVAPLLQLTLTLILNLSPHFPFSYRWHPGNPCEAAGNGPCGRPMASHVADGQSGQSHLRRQ